MSLRVELRHLRELEWRDLDLTESGSWPLLLQGLCCLLLLLLALAGTTWYLALPKAAELRRAEVEESRLLADYASRAAQAARLPGMLEQSAGLEVQLSGLVATLPAGAEIPALIDTISEGALEHHLSVDFIRLGSTVEGDYYIERPFDLQVEGGYHAIVSFLATTTALPHIVTLHDFVLAPVEAGEHLRLAMRARTYSYRPQSEEGEG